MSEPRPTGQWWPRWGISSWKSLSGGRTPAALGSRVWTSVVLQRLATSWLLSLLGMNELVSMVVTHFRKWRLGMRMVYPTIRPVRWSSRFVGYVYVLQYCWTFCGGQLFVDTFRWSLGVRTNQRFFQWFPNDSSTSKSSTPLPVMLEGLLSPCETVTAVWYPTRKWDHYALGVCGWDVVTCEMELRR